MISWIQKYFQKHFRLVFIVVLIAIGLPMVVIYSAGGGGHAESIKALERPFFGVNLANPEAARRVSLEAQISAFLRPDAFRLYSGNLESFAEARLAGLALADELHLPVPTSDQLSKYVAGLRVFQNKDGQFDQAVYARFADSLKAGTGGATVADVNRVLRDDARLAEVAKLLGGPGYLTNGEVQLQLAREDSVWSVQVASLDYATFTPALSPTEEALKKFHADNSFRYDIPAHPRFSLLEIKAAAFLPPVPPTEAELRAFYNANISAFPVPGEADKKDALATPATDNFPKVRDQVEAAIKEAASRKLASEAANKLTSALYEHRKEAPANSAKLADFLAGLRLAPSPVASFVPGVPPADRPWLVNYTPQVLRLNAERFFSDPLPSPDGFIVLLWNEDLPARTPAFLEVRDRVLADYQDAEKRRQFVERTNALKATLQAAAAAPGGFAAKAAAEKLEVKSFASFTLRQPPQDFPPAAFQTLLSLESGQVTSLVGQDEKGYVVYAQEKKVPDLSTSNPRFAEVRQRYAALVASYAQNALLGELVEQELKKTKAPDAR